MKYISILALSLFLTAPALAQAVPETAPEPKAIAAAPKDICANLQKEWDAKPNSATATIADTGKALCASGKYADGALKLRQALGK